MISFHDMEATLLLALALAVIVIVAAALDEGRGRHLLDLVRGRREGNVPQEGVLEHEVPRDDFDWDVVGRLDSPTRAEDGEPRVRFREIVAVKERTEGPSLKDRAESVKQSLPELKDRAVDLWQSRPALKELPVVRSLGASHEASTETGGTPVLADSGRR
ncbi:hypothetical protein [Demequina salsinemoris]|uniref:hypothetical protein n=1 Tax=Demequina salsinemoris TaxID=577470 RepID=UPI000784D082|nr:hypothetical protein [Demequina salsinemoris]